MFIQTEEYTINTDSITWATTLPTGMISINFANGKSIQLSRYEAECLFKYLNRQTLPKANSANSNIPRELNVRG
jgi:hypothetical protein